MKKLIKSSLFLAILSAVGFVVFRTSSKMKGLKEKYRNTIFFDGKNLKFNEEEFSGSSYAVMFAGLEMDFTEATLTDNDATLEIYGECCGISIKVPSDWQVEVDGTSDKSGVSNTTKFDEEESFKPILRIKYTVKFAGLEIKYI